MVTAAAASSSTTLVGIIVGVAAGLLTALMAGFFQGRNTTRTIAAEQARLDSTLEAERERHETQLSFERGETDRAELRTILDALAEHLVGLEDVTSQIRARAQAIADDAWVADDQGYFEHLSEQIDALSHDATREVERLRLRMGYEGFEIARRASMMRLHADSVRRITVADDPPDDWLERIEHEYDRLVEQRRRFTAEALKFTVARLHDPQPKQSPGA